MLHRLYREQQLNCTIESVWNFFSSHDHFSEATPEVMNFLVVSGILDRPVFKGMEIEYRAFSFLGSPIKWEMMISQVEDYKSFTGFQKKGPYKYWNHFHEFIPNDKGVLMKDTVDYELPLGIIGRIAHRLFIKKKLESIFDLRSGVLNALFNNNDY
ncbi:MULTISPECIES: SRPBCC family protein [Chryseobacterium]|uniref:SRPBCC family protein n=1 Tax=Chryseobacterium TaxID=59732 RepID=UPI0015524370|nr:MULTISPECIES: SRPBCC family protein [unclassified Chryseobacterium]MDC8104608.1 SRPBCC family protein [Chryseobacterium sp. B21-037]WBV58118.1 SRPBCC family protein [Chryseobacterium daecheongense]